MNTDFGGTLHGLVMGFHFATEVDDRDKMVPLSVLEKIKETVPDGARYKIHIGVRVFTAITNREIQFQTHSNVNICII